MPVELAAAQMGVPLDEVFSYISDKLSKVDALDFQLRKMGQAAVRVALENLTKLANEPPRVGKDFESTDLEAAKALAKFGLDALKMSRSGVKGKDSGSDDDDLFDKAADNPWNLKKVE